jgi:hypothetical protein
MSTVNTYTVGKVMQLIPINDETDKFNMDFYLKSENDFHFAIVDQVQLDEGKLLDFKQSDNGEVSGNVKSRDSGPVSYYIALKSIQDSTDITVSLAHRPLDKSQLTPPPPPQQPPQQRRMPPQQQQQQQRGMPPQQQQQQQRGMPPQQQRRMPPQQQQQRRMPPQQRRMPPQQRRMPQPQPQQQRRKPQSTPKNTMTSHPHTVNSTKNKNTLLLCIVGIVSLAIVGGLVWFFMFRKKEKAKFPVSGKKVRIPYQNSLRMHKPREYASKMKERLNLADKNSLRMHKPREYASKMKERLNLSEQNNNKQTRGENTSLLNKLKSIPTV